MFRVFVKRKRNRAKTEGFAPFILGDVIEHESLNIERTNEHFDTPRASNLSRSVCSNTGGGIWLIKYD